MVRGGWTMEKTQSRTEKPLSLLKAILAAYIVTAILLMILALLMFKAGLDEDKVSIGIIAVYLISTFLGGRIAGKGAESKKFLWGMVAGIAYFLILLLVTLISKQTVSAPAMQLVTTGLLCVGGGMLGGMLSP